MTQTAWSAHPPRDHGDAANHHPADTRVVENLRSLGFDIIRVTDILDARSSDRTILAEVARTQAVLVSHDQDFGAILASTGASAPSFVNLRLSEVDATRLAATIAQALRATQDDLVSGAVITLNDAGTWPCPSNAMRVTGKTWRAHCGCNVRTSLTHLMSTHR